MAHKSGPNGKWGRHYCRPHSHQRVATPYLARRPADLPPRWLQRILGARCLIPARPILRLCLATGASEFRHRRSRRHPAFAPALPRPPTTEVADVRSLAQALGRDRSFTDPVGAADCGLRRSQLPGPARFPACPVTQRRALLKRSGLPLAEASCMPSLDGRVDRCHRHPKDKSLQNFKALRRSVPVGLCPEDKLKVRFNRVSGNILRPEFSTNPRIACGHEWISQRFVVFVMGCARLAARNRLRQVTYCDNRHAATRACVRIRLLSVPDQRAIKRRDRAGRVVAAAARSA